MSASDKVMDLIHNNSEENPACVNLLQEMELVQEDSFFYEDPDREIDQAEIVHAPHPVPKLKSTSWGPVCGTRQSSRLDRGDGKTVLQMAQEITQRRTLEKVVPAASKLKDPENDPEFCEKVETHPQGRHAGGSGSLLQLPGTENERTPSAKWLTDGKHLASSPPGNGQISPPLQKKPATQGAWDTPVSTLESATFVSPT